MAVVDTQHGLRVTLERSDRDDGLRYLGEVALDAARYPVELSVGDDGRISLGPDSTPSELLDKARLVLRATLKQQQSLGLPPPRRITRWRPVH